MVRAKVYGVVGVDRQFAIKQILPALTANPTYAQALSAAARSYGSLEHPRIARLAEFTVSQGKTFTATELVTGLDVGRLVAESRISGTTLPPGGALTLLSAAARAVGYAHGRGLVHLGLCPQNLLVSTDGDIKVTDFGILAACLPERPVQDPRLAHRVAYLAPEQLVGEPTSAATDVFALGAIAIEMVTSSPAFRGETPLDVQHAVLSGQITDPSLPRPLVKVLQRCLARAPFERFPDARAFADALDAALRSAPVRGTRVDMAERVKNIMAHLEALNEGGLSGVVSMPSAVRPAQGRPPTVLSPEVIATPTSLPDNDRFETAEFLRDDALQDDAEDELEGDTRDGTEAAAALGAPVQPVFEFDARSQRITDAPMIAATLRGISAVSPPRPTPPPSRVPAPPRVSGPPPSQRLPNAGPPPSQRLPNAGPPPVPPSARPGTGKVPTEVEPLASPDGPEHAPGLRVNGDPAGESAGMASPGTSSERFLRPELSLEEALLPANPGRGGAASESDLAGSQVKRDDGDTTAQHRALGSAWDEAMETFEQPTRLNESVTASLLPSANRTGPAPLLDLDELFPQRESTSQASPAARRSASRIPGAPSVPGAGAERDSRPLAAAGSFEALPAQGSRDSRPAIASSATGALAAPEPAEPELIEPSMSAPSQPPMPALIEAPMPAPGEVPMSALIEAPPVRPSGRIVPSSALQPIVERDVNPWSMVPQQAAPSGMGPPMASPMMPMASPPPAPFQAPYQRQPTGSTYGAHQHQQLPPLGFAPDEPVPRLSGGGGRWLWMLLGVAIVAGSGVGAYVLFFGGLSQPRGTLAISQPEGPDARPGAAASAHGTTPDARDARAAQDAGAATPRDGGERVATATDAGASPVDGKPAEVKPPEGTAGATGATTGATTDGLTIISKPAGARVYIDGADQGQTPLKMPGPADRHSAVLFLAGYDLTTLEIDKAGTFNAELKEITPLGGPAGIKVRCRMKDRYYVYIDGKATGALCPTERLEVDRGEHVVEIYDLVSETRRQFRINVKVTSRSTRVRVD